jgi:hypothetical protein
MRNNTPMWHQAILTYLVFKGPTEITKEVLEKYLQFRLNLQKIKTVRHSRQQPRSEVLFKLTLPSRMVRKMASGLL